MEQQNKSSPFEAIANYKLRKKKREIETLKLEIQKAKLEKQLKEINK